MATLLCNYFVMKYCYFAPLVFTQNWAIMEVDSCNCGIKLAKLCNFLANDPSKPGSRLALQYGGTWDSTRLNNSLMPPTLWESHSTESTEHSVQFY